MGLFQYVNLDLNLHHTPRPKLQAAGFLAWNSPCLEGRESSDTGTQLERV